MLQPLRNESYTFKSVPLTADEKKLAEKKGETTTPVRGVFRFRGFGGRKHTNRKILIFQCAATVEDGVTYVGRRIALTSDDFEIGLDLGKIRGRAKKVST